MYYPGRVVSKASSDASCYNVQFDDGDAKVSHRLELILCHLIPVGCDVMASPPSELEYCAATVLAHEDDDSYTVQFPDSVHR